MAVGWTGFFFFFFLARGTQGTGRACVFFFWRPGPACNAAPGARRSAHGMAWHGHGIAGHSVAGQSIAGEGSRAAAEEEECLAWHAHAHGSMHSPEGEGQGDGPVRAGNARECRRGHSTACDGERERMRGASRCARPSEEKEEEEEEETVRMAGTALPQSRREATSERACKARAPHVPSSCPVFVVVSVWSPGMRVFRSIAILCVCLPSSISHGLRSVVRWGVLPGGGPRGGITMCMMCLPPEFVRWQVYRSLGGLLYRI
jgi:hypothetical protein